MAVKDVDDRRIVEVVNHALQNGDEAAVDLFGINAESLGRYKREFRTRFGDFDRRVLIEKIASKYTNEELKTIAAGQRSPVGVEKHVVTREGQTVKFGFMTDTHIGSIFFREELFLEAIRTMQEEGCEFIIHSGDVTEGMSNRPDQVYQLTHLGYSQQKKYAIELLSRWNKPIYAIQGNHDCLSVDTEVFTDSGWKTVFQLKPDDMILSYDTENDNCKFDFINDIVVHEYEGDMVQTETLGHSSLVTPNHRVLLQKPKLVNGKKTPSPYTYVLAKDMTGTVKIPCSSNSDNEEYPIDDDVLKLVGWLLTDANLSKGGRFTIYQSKKDNIKIIREILSSVGVNYSETVRDRDITEICGKKLKKRPLPSHEFSIKEDGVSLYLHDLLPTRIIQPWMYNLSDRQFHILFDEVIRADGTNVRDTGTAYALYKDYDFLSSFQGLCVMHGYRAYLSCNNRGDYVLNISRMKTADIITRSRTKTVKYKGIVWCLSVPETNFMVRRNGKCYFTGNCWYEKSNGAYIVEDIAAAIPGMEYLGDHEGDLIINGVTIRLWHGNDGSSYSTSYRLQKLVEAFTGGEKPHVLLAGHTHKQGYFFDRNIHVVSGGALSLQSSWMRSKRLANHTGYHIIEMELTEDGVTRFKPEWFPFFV